MDPVELSITIDRPREEVFEYLADIANHPEFSDHYLNLTLPARPDWKALADEARPALEEIAGPLDSYTPSENEDSAKGRAVASTTQSGRHVGLTNSAFS